jgi:hypothetical protein
LNQGNAQNSPNFVLAHFDPSHFYEPTANDQDIVADGWDIFVNLITKARSFPLLFCVPDVPQAITGNMSKPNYVVGHHGQPIVHFLAFHPLFW